MATIFFKTSEHRVVKMVAELSDFQELLPLVSAFGRENPAVRRFSAFYKFLWEDGQAPGEIALYCGAKCNDERGVYSLFLRLY